ncbi:MAG TPA: PH domain-containing protein [Acidimicrobiia bacterium]
MPVRPDRRWITKQWLVLSTITAFAALAAVIAHAVVRLATEPGTGVDAAVTAIWASFGGVVALSWAITVPAVLLWFKNLDYEIEPDKVIIRKGILTKTQQNIPMRMITDFRLQRTLYDRFLGIGSIQIQTAGQSQTATGYEGKLAGLDAWAGLHEDLRSRLRHRPGSPAVSEPGAPGAEDIHALLEEVQAIRRVLEASR